MKNFSLQHLIVKRINAEAQMIMFSIYLDSKKSTGLILGKIEELTYNLHQFEVKRNDFNLTQNIKVRKVI